jgi:hypothetical protein
MVFSHSRINTFKRCPKLYEYKYIQGLHPLGSDRTNLILGSIVHKGIELRNNLELLNYIDELNLPPNEKNETMIVLALAMVDAYFDRFGNKEIKHSEMHFEIDLDGEKLQGYIDSLIEEEDGFWMEEIKTASQINKEYIDKLQFDDQVSRYNYVIQNNLVENFNLHKPFLGTKYRILKKPQIRQKKDETIVQFRNRLVEKMSEPGYIEEIILNRTEQEVEDCVLDTIQDIKIIRSTCRFSKNLSACNMYGRCPYMELCMNEPDAILLYNIEEVEEEEESEQL